MKKKKKQPNYKQNQKIEMSDRSYVAGTDGALTRLTPKTGRKTRKAMMQRLQRQARYLKNAAT